jgi:hypothetical protein
VKGAHISSIEVWQPLSIHVGSSISHPRVELLLKCVALDIFLFAAFSCLERSFFERDFFTPLGVFALILVASMFAFMHCGKAFRAWMISSTCTSEAKRNDLLPLDVERQPTHERFVSAPLTGDKA